MKVERGGTLEGKRKRADSESHTQRARREREDKIDPGAAERISHLGIKESELF